MITTLVEFLEMVKEGKEVVVYEKGVLITSLKDQPIKVYHIDDEAGVRCPKCGAQMFAEDEYSTNFRCSNIDCMHMITLQNTGDESD